ncbi:hypothetical protein ACVIWU_006452 [Bradyrhizobium sp. USDA 4509]
MANKFDQLCGEKQWENLNFEHAPMVLAGTVANKRAAVFIE